MEAGLRAEGRAVTVAGGAPLYAVIEGRALVWRVVDFTAEGIPRMVPVGEWVRRDGDAVLKLVPVSAGQTWEPVWGDTVMYTPDYLSLMGTIEPWIKDVPDE